MQRNPLIKVLLACLLFGLCCKRSRRRSGQQLMMMMMMMIAHTYLGIMPYNDVQQVTVFGVILPIWVSEYGYSAATTSWVGSLPSLFQLAFGIIVGWVFYDEKRCEEEEEEDDDDVVVVVVLVVVWLAGLFSEVIHVIATFFFFIYPLCLHWHFQSTDREDRPPIARCCHVCCVREWNFCKLIRYITLGPSTFDNEHSMRLTIEN